MNRIRILLTLVVILSVLLIIMIAFSGAPVQAQPNAQATSTPAPAASTPAPASQDQTFVTLLPGASGAGRLIILTLKADKTAEMVTDPLGADPTINEVGTWASSGGNLTLTLTGDGTKKYDTPVTLGFTQEPERLVATSFDKAVFGAAGLSLYLRDDIEAKIASTARAYVTLDLASGFPLDPFLVSVNGGGELDASILNDKCQGYINGNPSVAVNWSGKADLVRVFTYSDADPVLVVQAPDGKFLCGDDVSALVLDSEVEIANPPAGTYNIWVGSAQPDQLLPTILVLSARSDVNLSNFDLGDLVKRPPLAASGEAQPSRQTDAKIFTEAVARFKGTSGGALGATPLTHEVSGEGEIAAFDIDFGDAICSGFIAETPDFVFDVSSATKQLTVLFEGDEDATLLVAGPEGAVSCNDDSVEGTNANPSITLQAPANGRYAVFVGRLDQDATVKGTLTVTTAAQAVPQVLPPSE